MEKAIRFLNDLGRADLAALIRFSEYTISEADNFGPVLEITSPAIFAEALSGLPEWDQQRIVESVASTSELDRRPFLSQVAFVAAKEAVIPEEERLYPEIVVHRNQMIEVATGKLRIQEVNDSYRVRQRRISTALQNMGIEHLNPHADLWDWYHKWRAEFPSYADRRRYVNDLYGTLLENLAGAHSPPVPVREPTGWERVDRAVEKARAGFAAAHHEEDYQSVGLFCREILISLGQAVYDPATQSTPDGVKPSETDAGRMIEAFLLSVAAGGSNESLRKHTRAALALAVELQHKRTAGFRGTALCLEATSSVVNILAILAGRRDPPPVLPDAP